MQGLKMGSIAGNDQNALLYDFMQKFGIKWRKICKIGDNTVECVFEAQ